VNARARLAALIVILLALAGFVSGSGRVLALAVPFLVILGAGVVSRPAAPRLALSRTLDPPRTTDGVPVTVTVTVRNVAVHAAVLLVEDLVPAGLSVATGSPRFLARLLPGQERAWSYTVAGRRGEHCWESVAVECRGLLDGWSGTFSSASTLVLLPRTVRLPRVSVRPRQTRGFAGPIASGGAGPGSIFHSVREYRPGDLLRRVNWRRSSHSPDRLFTNELERERIADIGIVLDARERSYPFDEAGALFEAAVLAAGSLADHFLVEGERVALLVYGHEWGRVGPGYGRAQRERIRERLARAATGTNYALQNLAYLPPRLFPPGSQVIMVSPLNPDDATVLTAMRGLGYSVAALSPDPVADEARRRIADLAGPRGPALRGALRLAGLERALLLQSLRRVGLAVVDWDCGTSPAASLRACLAREPLARQVRGRLS
jgi:uncharacterized protein (DUF58 family)